MNKVYEKKRNGLMKIVVWTLFLCAVLMFSQDVQAAYTDDTGSFEFSVKNEKAVITGYIPEKIVNNTIVIPEKLTYKSVSYPVAEIGENAFYNLPAPMKSVKLPESLRVIGENAFYNAAIENIIIPAGVENIGYRAFADIEQFAVTFAAGSRLSIIGEKAFYITGLSEVIIPASVTMIGNSAFEGTDLTSVTFEKGSRLSAIGDSAFMNLSTLTTLLLPDGIQTIGKKAFYGLGVSSMTIPASVTYWGEGVFKQCKSLTSVTFAPGCALETIPDSAFYQTAITQITIPASVKELGGQAFYRCRDLEMITFAEGSHLETIGANAFYFADAMTAIEIPASVKAIGDSAFNCCFDLETIVIQEGSVLESIGIEAFYSAGVKQVNLPFGLITISDEAFYGTKLEEVIIPPSVTALGAKSFGGLENWLNVIYYSESLGSQAEDAFGNVDLTSSTYYDTGLKGEYTISDTVPPVVNITYSGTAKGEVEIPTSIPGAEDAQIKVGDIPVLPTSYSTDCRTTVLSQLAGKLPAGYSFETPATNLPAGETTECTAVYTSNGMTYKFTTKIVVAAHEENKVLLYTGKGEKEATCTENGVAHTECDICDATITGNIVIEETGHQTTEIRDAKTPTCTEKGYTGDTWCTDCKTKIESGKEIAMKEHTWDGGVVTKQPTRLEKGVKTFTCKACQATKTEDIPSLGAHAKGIKLPDDKNQGFYKVTKAGLTGGTVEYVKPLNKNKKTVSIPATVKIDGIAYKVTSIAKNAFKNNKNIKKLTIGANVSKIGAKAFFGCKNLKTIMIKTKKLKNNKVGAKAFKGIKSKATIKVPKNKYDAYKKLLKKKGVGNKAVFKKLK